MERCPWASWQHYLSDGEGILANAHLVLAGTVGGELVSGLLCWLAGLNHM